MQTHPIGTAKNRSTSPHSTASPPKYPQRATTRHHRLAASRPVLVAARASSSCSTPCAPGATSSPHSAAQDSSTLASAVSSVCSSSAARSTCVEPERLSPVKTFRSTPHSLRTNVRPRACASGVVPGDAADANSARTLVMAAVTTGGAAKWCWSGTTSPRASNSVCHAERSVVYTMKLVLRPQRRTIRGHVPRPRAQIPAGGTHARQRSTTRTAHPSVRRFPPPSGAGSAGSRA